mmetsp:Transcript_1845/g.4859  ORF Transcript_1845/g.4859 Transcript_1845/m.4859 type:complete len:285 (+) Transcript_1845:1629-2483(+)
MPGSPQKPPGHVRGANIVLAALGNSIRRCRCRCRCRKRKNPQIGAQIPQRVVPVAVVFLEIGKAFLALRPVEGDSAAQDRIPSENGDPVDVHPPQEAHGQSGPPPGVKVAVHAQHPRPVPMVPVDKGPEGIIVIVVVVIIVVVIRDTVGSQHNSQAQADLHELPESRSPLQSFPRVGQHQAPQQRQAPPENHGVHRPGPVAFQFLGRDGVLEARQVRRRPRLHDRHQQEGQHKLDRVDSRGVLLVQASDDEKGQDVGGDLGSVVDQELEQAEGFVALVSHLLGV